MSNRIVRLVIPIGARTLAKRALQRTVYRSVNRVTRPTKVNVGGGASFCEIGWANLEEAPGTFNHHPFVLTPECVFPFADGSIDTVYTSHAMEHLDPPTAGRVIGEARRVLQRGGRLVIKIPDFDAALECWRRQDPTFFTDAYWGYDRVRDTWAPNNVSDTLDCRAAMLFCGFWNSAYGHHFKGIVKGATAYYGPPRLPPGELRALAHSLQPLQISATLRAAVVQSESSYTFSHQNSWSRRELRGFLHEYGLTVQSDETAIVIHECRDIPGLDNKRAQSLYSWAAKP